MSSVLGSTPDVPEFTTFIRPPTIKPPSPDANPPPTTFPTAF